MPEPKGKSFIFLECPLCQGKGVIGSEDCRRCSEQGLFAWLEGDILYWNKKIDTLHIFEEEIERTVKSLINGFLIFFGVLGLVAAFATLYQLAKDSLYFWDFIKVQNGLMGIFAVTLLTDLYAYYRMQRQSNLEKTIQPKRFETITTLEEPNTLFEETVAADKGERIEVSSTLTIEANKVVEQAWQLAKKLEHGEALPLHILATLLAYNQTRVVLGRLGVDGKSLVDKITRSLFKVPRVKGKTELSESFKKVLLHSYADGYYARRERVDVPQL
ncbi:hypothetical protein KKC06_01460, partial [Patescibacteria group bacterium]|nr:hypothetical protein [Patescibacteria group bacterium]